MTRRTRPDHGFLFRFTRWQPLADGPADGHTQMRPTCAGCGTTTTATLLELAGADWHRSDIEYLCGECSLREKPGRVDEGEAIHNFSDRHMSGNPATSLKCCTGSNISDQGRES